MKEKFSVNEIQFQTRISLGNYKSMNSLHAFYIEQQKYCKQEMCTLNDPLGQTHSPVSSYHYSH